MCRREVVSLAGSYNNPGSYTRAAIVHGRMVKWLEHLTAEQNIDGSTQAL